MYQKVRKSVRKLAELTKKLCECVQMCRESTYDNVNCYFLVQMLFLGLVQKFLSFLEGGVKLFLVQPAAVKNTNLARTVLYWFHDNSRSFLSNMLKSAIST